MDKSNKLILVYLQINYTKLQTLQVMEIMTMSHSERLVYSDVTYGNWTPKNGKLLEFIR
jgi:hypothetical protein